MALTRITKGVIKPNENYDTHNINSTGIVTATKFVGPFDSINVSGAATFTGNVTIGGTLTYEDVTNIDSVGIITARDGIHVGAGVSVVGIVTAATFKGDGDFFDIDVDGHTNLDNVSIAGVTTFTGITTAGISYATDFKAPDGNGNGFYVGNSDDLHLFHNGADSYIENDTGNLTFTNKNSNNIIFKTTSSEVEKVRITSSGSVGVGTNNPNVGNSAYPVVQVHGTSTNAYFKLTNTTTGVAPTDGVELSLSGSDAYLTNRENANIIFRTNDGSSTGERLRIDSSGRLLKSGQAILTSTSLSHPIQVAADSSAQNIVLFGRASDDISAIDFYEADKSTRLGEIQYRTNELNIRHRSAGADIIFATTPSGGSLGNRLRITSGGDVGIGYNSPTVKLHIREAASGYSGTYDNRYHCIIEDDAEAYYGIYVPDNGYGGIRFHRASGGASATSAVGYIDCYMANEEMHYYVRGSGTSGKHIFSTAGTERFRIASDGKIYVGGNGASATSGELWFNDTSAYSSKIAQASGSSALTFHTGSSQPERLRISANSLRFNSTSQQIHLNTSDGSDNGFLNIGAAGGDNNQNRAGQMVFYGNEASGNQGKIGILAGNSGNTNGFIYFQTGGSERLRITSTGKVGINETSPDNMLHVRSDNTAAAKIGGEGGSAYYMEIGQLTTSSSPGFNATGSGASMLFKMNGSEKFRLGPSGQFGLNGSNYGTSGQVLTSQGNSATPTWTTVSGTTINSNADNRIITGSGTANTLNGESGLTFDGTNLVMNTSGRIFTTRTSGEAGVLIGSSNAGGATLYLDGDSNGDWSGGDYAYIRHSTSGHLEIRSTNPADNGEIHFYTGTAGTYYGGIMSDGRLSLSGAGNSRAIEINPGSNAGSIVLDRNGYITSMIRASDGGSNVGGGSGGGSRLHLAKTAINFQTFPYVSNVGDAVTYTTRASIDTSGNFVPGANDNYNLGTSSLRWANLYVNDLQLSNETKKDEGGNDVDGTWGDWTLQEGENKIFMINNRTGKRYSLKMEEE